MIDIHCHILPGVDDGARTMTESLSLAQEAVDQGIHTIIATPHHQDETHNNAGEHIPGMVGYLNGKLEEEQIPVTILPGQEARIHGDMVEGLETRDIIPLYEDGRYILMELPRQQVPSYVTQLLFDLQIAGYKPIIANPERNNVLMEDPDKLYHLVKNGALTQVAAASVVGKLGKQLQKFANQLIEANLAHFVASDAHDVKKRSFYMQPALEEIKKQHGAIKQQQFENNSEAVVDGTPVYVDPPERIKRKKFLGIL